MSVATAGVPHPAASVRLSPHPSASEALATIHERRYTSTSSSWSIRPANSIQSAPPRRAACSRQRVTFGTVADDRQRESRDLARVRLRRHPAAARTASRARVGRPPRSRGAGCCSPPGRESRVGPVGNREDPVGVESEFEQLLAGRLRRRRREASAVDRRRDREPRGLARIAASGPGRIWSHIGPWTWWRNRIRGRRHHTGEKNGTPFITSTTAS